MRNHKCEGASGIGFQIDELRAEANETEAIKNVKTKARKQTICAEREEYRKTRQERGNCN